LGSPLLQAIVHGGAGNGKRALDEAAAARHMAAMPRHDPVPPRRSAPQETARLEEIQRTARAWLRYKKMMKWMLLAAAVAVLAALGWLKSTGEPMPIHMIIATAAGVGLSVLVGTGLMGLVFLSNNSGHDDAAGRTPEQ
jgi:hypothetical protein